MIKKYLKGSGFNLMSNLILQDANNEKFTYLF